MKFGHLYQCYVIFDDTGIVYTTYYRICEQNRNISSTQLQLMAVFYSLIG